MIPLLLRLAFLLALPSAVLAATAPVVSVPPKAVVPPAKPKAPGQSSGTQWTFSILPRSLQKNPRVEMTVITEMTDEGRQLPEVSPPHPAYFVTQSAGFHALGNAPRNEKAPLPAALEEMLKKSLATNGYLPANPPTRSPSLLVIYTWGSHYALHPEEDDSISGVMVMRNILDRAGLVGGQKFALELQKLFEQKAALLEANPPARVDPAGVVPGIEPILGQAQLELADPIRLFSLQSAKNSFVIDQAFDDVYYVVASAYDYQAMGRNERRLLWRTRMTVDAKGVAMLDTLPTLIETAAPYFGREMTEPETLIKRALKEGQVEVGTPTVVQPGSETKK